MNNNSQLYNSQLSNNDFEEQESPAATVLQKV